MPGVSTKHSVAAPRSGSGRPRRRAVVALPKVDELQLQTLPFAPCRSVAELGVPEIAQGRVGRCTPEDFFLSRARSIKLRRYLPRWIGRGDQGPHRFEIDAEVEGARSSRQEAGVTMTVQCVERPPGNALPEVPAYGDAAFAGRIVHSAAVYASGIGDDVVAFLEQMRTDLPSQDAGGFFVEAAVQLPAEIAILVHPVVEGVGGR